MQMIFQRNVNPSREMFLRGKTETETISFFFKKLHPYYLSNKNQLNEDTRRLMQMGKIMNMERHVEWLVNLS